MSNIYQNGKYLETTQTWHSEDSLWKADQIHKIIEKNELHVNKIAEIGCGAGQILSQLSDRTHFNKTVFTGYDISKQAIELSNQINKDNISFHCRDLLTTKNPDYYDILLIIDVFEHVPDYMGFVSDCRVLADFKIYHIPLDIHVSSVMRNTFIRGRYTIGHLHYFTAESAIATLKDTGHEIIDYSYTDNCFGLFRQHKSLKTAMANGPRWLFSRFSVPLTARIFGGYSLLVLAK